MAIGFKDPAGNFHPTERSSVKSKIKTKHDGIKIEIPIKNKNVSDVQHAENVARWRDNASDLYKLYVSMFPNSHIAMDLRRAGIPSHGHFGEALYEGRYEDAMYRADSDNLIKLHELGIEAFLSKEKKHPDDTSPYEEFLSRYKWAVKHRRDMR